VRPLAIGARISKQGTPKHHLVTEFVTQYWASMYYNSWNICKSTSHCFLDCSSDHGTIIKAKGQLSSKCSMSYSTLKPSIAFQTQTSFSTGFLVFPDLTRSNVLGSPIQTMSGPTINGKTSSTAGFKL
jgi:hypothetical protein